MASRLEDPPDHIHLTTRDTQLVSLIGEGLPPAAIATKTGYSERHIRRITAALFARIGATSRVHAAALATRWGLGSPD